MASRVELANISEKSSSSTYKNRRTLQNGEGSHTGIKNLVRLLCYIYMHVILISTAVESNGPYATITLKAYRKEGSKLVYHIIIAIQVTASCRRSSHKQFGLQLLLRLCIICTQHQYHQRSTCT